MKNVVKKIISIIIIISISVPIFFSSINYAVEETQKNTKNETQNENTTTQIPQATSTPKEEEENKEQLPEESNKSVKEENSYKNQETQEKDEKENTEQKEEQNQNETEPITLQGVTISNPSTPLENGKVYEIYFAETTKVLDVQGPSRANSANIALWERSNQDNQKFRVIYNSDDKTYTFINVYSGLVIDALGGVGRNEVNVGQYAGYRPYAANQRWYLIDNNDGTYSIRSKLGNYNLDIAHGDVGAYNGQNAQIYTSHSRKITKICIS